MQDGKTQHEQYTAEREGQGEFEGFYRYYKESAAVPSESAVTPPANLRRDAQRRQPAVGRAVTHVEEGTGMLSQNKPSLLNSTL